MSQTMKEFQGRLEAIRFSEVGAEECLRELCELGLEFSPNSPDELMMAFRFKESLCGRIAELIGVDTDAEFSAEDFNGFIGSLEIGLSVDDIGRNFTRVKSPS